MLHFTDIPRLSERTTPFKHHIGRPAPQDKYQPLTLVEQLVTATAEQMREKEAFEPFRPNPMVTAQSVAPYVTQTLSEFAPADRFNRYELLWFTAWLDTAFSFSSALTSELTNSAAVDLPEALCIAAFRNVVTRRMTGDIDFYASEGTIGVNRATQDSPTTSDAALYDACYQYSDIQDQIETLSIETRTRLDDTGRVEPEAVTSAFQTVYCKVGPETPLSPPRVGALQDNLLVCYPLSESPVDLSTVPTPQMDSSKWVDLVQTTTQPLLKRAVIADLITEGVLDQTRHPAPSHR